MKNIISLSCAMSVYFVCFASFSAERKLIFKGQTTLDEDLLSCTIETIDEPDASYLLYSDSRGYTPVDFPIVKATEKETRGTFKVFEPGRRNGFDYYYTPGVKTKGTIRVYKKNGRYVAPIEYETCIESTILGQLGTGIYLNCSTKEHTCEE